MCDSAQVSQGYQASGIKGGSWKWSPPIRAREITTGNLGNSILAVISKLLVRVEPVSMKRVCETSFTILSATALESL